MVASLLRYFRTLHNLKQKTVVDLLGMSQVNYSDLENGKTKLSYIADEKLVTEYGMSFNQLIAEKGIEQNSFLKEHQPSNQLNYHGVKEYGLIHNIGYSANR